MENFNTTDMENYVKKIDEKYADADRDADKMGYQEFKSAYADTVEKAFHYKGMSDVEIENRFVDKVNETYDALTVKHSGSDVGVNISITDVETVVLLTRVNKYKSLNLRTFSSIPRLIRIVGRRLTYSISCGLGVFFVLFQI